MYDDWRDPVPFLDDPVDLARRVTHLVYVGGRLVDHWSEPAAGTRWAEHVERPVPPRPPDPPTHEKVRSWLAEICGSPAAVAALDTEPLDEPVLDLSRLPDRPAEERVAAAAVLLDDLAERQFDAETGRAFRTALAVLAVEDPESVTRPTSPAHLAGGVCWAVGKANGLFHPVGRRRLGVVQDALGLAGGLSSQGNPVGLALRGFRGRGVDRWARPAGVPDLLAVGRTDVLVAATRERLVRLRERADAAAAA